MIVSNCSVLFFLHYSDHSDVQQVSQLQSYSVTKAESEILFQHFWSILKYQQTGVKDNPWLSTL